MVTQKRILNTAPITPKNITLIQAEKEIPSGIPSRENAVGSIPQYLDKPAPSNALPPL